MPPLTQRKNNFVANKHHAIKGRWLGDSHSRWSLVHHHLGGVTKSPSLKPRHLINLWFLVNRQGCVCVIKCPNGRDQVALIAELS